MNGCTNAYENKTLIFTGTDCGDLYFQLIGSKKIFVLEIFFIFQLF